MSSKMLLLFFLVLSVNGYIVLPFNKGGWDEVNAYSCAYQLSLTATFAETPDFYAPCYNDLALASLAGCMANGKGIGNPAQIITDCKTYYNFTITEEDWSMAYDNYTKNAVPIDEIPDFNSTVAVDVPIKLDPETRQLYLQSYTNYYNEMNKSLYYGSGLLGYWVVVFILAAIAHWSKLLLPGIVKKFSGPFSNFWRRHLTMPAVGRKSRAQEKYFLKYVAFLAPSRIESVIVFLFLVLVIGSTSHYSKVIPNDPLFEAPVNYYGETAGYRTGVAATMLTPPLVLFAGRNNFLQWLTGLNFATFITFHKWVSRIVFLLVIAHAIGWSLDFGAEYAADMKENYIIWGVIATVAPAIMMVQSLLYFRRRWYEIFLLLHILFACFFVGGSFIHVAPLGWAWFYYATFAVWVFDRFVRVVRLIWFGCPKATVKLLPNETIKVIVRKPKYWPAVPGGHAFVHFMRPSCFWQSHPFTFTVTGESDHIVMYCKIKGGVTHGLYQYLSTHPEKTAQIRVSLEGPYGEPAPVRRYDSAIFVAGGNGVPGLYSESLDLAQRENPKQTIKLYWVVREYSSVVCFFDELSALKGSKVECVVYVTRTNTATSPTEELHEKKLTNESSSERLDKADGTLEKVRELDEPDTVKIHQDLDHIQIVEGRPNLEALVKSEIEESRGSIAFVACAAPVMVDELRYFTTQSLRNTNGKRIDFFEEIQVWA